MRLAKSIMLFSLLASALLAGCGDSEPVETNFQAAATVIGQVTFTAYSSSSVDSRAVDAHTIDGPYGSPLINNGILYLPDAGSNRVLGFNSVPTTNGARADFVLGQVDLVSSTGGTTANTLKGPESVRYANGKLFVNDFGNSRILIWNAAPTVTGVSADVVVGQADFTSGSCIGGAAGLCFPDDIFVVGSKLIVADSANNRVLIWNTLPTVNGTPADIVLGQGNFTLTTKNDDNQDGLEDASPSNRTLNNPTGIWSDGIKLVICDDINHRVLIWNTFPTANFAAADVVLGQNDFSHNTENDDNQDRIADARPSARALFFPYYVTSNGTQLFVADTGNNRVLMWNTIPTSNFAAANKVLGQATFTAQAPNDNNQDGIQDAAPSARTLSFPSGLYLFGSKLFVTDGDNNRYVIFNL